MSSKLAVCVLVLGVVWAPTQTPEEGPPVRLAQQTFTPPPPPPPGLPSIIPQTQAYTGCIMNCDTAAGSCQSGCSVSNSPDRLSTAGLHDTLTQCYLGCTSTLLQCKQTCPSPH